MSPGIISSLVLLFLVVNESLRLYPTLPMLLPREASQDTKIGGYFVPSGTMLMVNAWAIQRDPVLWDKPDEFMPERFEGRSDDKYKMLAFSVGRRGCPGTSLGYRVLGLALGTLIQAFEWEKIGDEMVDMNAFYGLSMAKLTPLQALCKPPEHDSSVSIICQKRGHFARNFPDKKRSHALIHALNQVEPVDVSDLESLYYLDDEPSDSVLCTIAYSDFSSDDDCDTNSLESDFDFKVHMINPISHVLPIQEDPPLPLAKFHLLMDAYAKPIPVIAFFDTGSSVSILNPNILPDHYWKPHHQNFIAANGKKFVIDNISVPINILLFSKCVIKRRLLGSSSHGKDLLIGFDILHKLPNLRWSGEGLHYKSFFNPWTAMHRLFVASITPPIFNISSIKQRLIQTCCASSHTEFLSKHPSPLWLNP
ncbi:zinc finger, CCHC-type, viral movement protein [Tanacetum coccineum]